MTDLLRVFGGKDRDPARPSPSEEFFRAPSPKKTPSWLRKSPACSPPPAGFLRGLQAGMGSKPINNLTISAVFNPNLRLTINLPYRTVSSRSKERRGRGAATITNSLTKSTRVVPRGNTTTPFPPTTFRYLCRLSKETSSSLSITTELCAPNLRNKSNTSVPRTCKNWPEPMSLSNKKARPTIATADTNQFSLESQYVAIKIVKSAEMFHCVAQDEIKLLRNIKSADPKHQGYKHVIQMLDYFQVLSINGYHTCISFELMGPSLLHLLIQSDYCGIHLPGVRNILNQVLKGLVYLHNICKIIHTDIKPENILIKVKDEYIRNLVETSTRYTELGVQMPRTYVSAETWENYVYCRPPQEFSDQLDPDSVPEKPRARSVRTESITKEDDVNIPEKLHRSNMTRQMLYISPSIEVKIADLGNACWEDHHFTTNIQTKQYRALEVILGAEYSYPADIWSVGCLAFELTTGEYLFNPKRTNSISSTEDHILLICELLGGIPKYIAQRGSYSNRFFDSSGTLRFFNDLQLRIWKTEDVLVDKYKWRRVDAIPFAALIESMIEPDPDLRLTAEDALKSEWLNEIQ